MRHVAVRRFSFAVVPAFAFLFAPSLVTNRSSQTFPTMSPGYSSYTSYTNDGKCLYTSVQVSGAVNGSCPTQPAYLVNECHATTHAPQAYNVTSGVEAGSTGALSHGTVGYLTPTARRSPLPGARSTHSRTPPRLSAVISARRFTKFLTALFT